MTKYRFKTEEEFKADDEWNDAGHPRGWNAAGRMNNHMGKDIPDKHIDAIEKHRPFSINAMWSFNPNNCILNSIEMSEEETKEILNQVNKSLITKEKMNTKTSTKSVKKNPVGDKFVFMDKTVNILNVGFSTSKNVILYGPGE